MVGKLQKKCGNWFIWSEFHFTGSICDVADMRFTRKDGGRDQRIQETVRNISRQRKHYSSHSRVEWLEIMGYPSVAATTRSSEVVVLLIRDFR